MALLSKKGRTRRLALPRRQKRVLLCGLTLLAAAGLVLLCTRILRSWMGGLGGSGTVAAVGLQPLRPPAAPLSLLPREIWAGGALPAADDAPHPDPATVRSLLKHSEVRQLMALCGRCLTHSLTNVLVGHDLAQWVFVSTGDIPDEWIRDAAVQMGIYLPRVARQPALRRLIEGAIRTQAFFITQDPYANSFNHRWAWVYPSVRGRAMYTLLYYSQVAGEQSDTNHYVLKCESACVCQVAPRQRVRQGRAAAGARGVGGVSQL